jgi:cell division protease FtsH
MTKQASAPPTPGKGAPVAPPPPPRWRHYLWALAFLIFIGLYFVLPATEMKSPVTLNYTQFLSDVSGHKVKTVTLETNGSASGTLSNGNTYTTAVPAEAGQALLTDLAANKVQITAETTGTSFGAEVLSWVILLLPFIVIGYFWWRLSKRAGGGAGGLQGVLGAGRSKAKVFDQERPKTTFADVAGYDGAKAEVAEVVDFLSHPERYAKAGAMAPRGVLMVGPPGTGKTLLARAVAGEASVPFFSVTGSSFVEMFVGVGAARVRDLFSEARKKAPAIIFIDEIDAIGQRRGGAGAVVSNDEREQTLNQLLAEMDGFDPATGIVVLAATNRPEVLDPALLRPGRFDRQITVPLPNLAERLAILRVHCRGKRLATDVDLEVVARGTPGFSGADLANLVNEAAIVAVRANRDVLGAADFDQARDRIILGRREGSNVLLPDEKYARGRARVGPRPGGGLLRQRRPGGQGHHPAGRPGARGNRAAAPGGAPPLRPGLPRRHAGRVPGRPGQRAGGLGPGVDGGLQRPGQGHRVGHQDGARVRPVRQAGAGRLPVGGVGVPGRGQRVLQPARSPKPPRPSSTARCPSC